MSITFIVLRKELMDALRDRRSLFTSIILPLVSFPLLLGGLAVVQRGMMEEQSERELKVGFAQSPGVPQDFLDELKQKENLSLTMDVPLGEVQAQIDAGTLDGVFLFSKDFLPAVTGLQDTGYVNLYYKDKLEPVVQDRLRALIKDYRTRARETRFGALGVTEQQLVVVEVGHRDLSSPRESIAGAVGGMVPYIFIIIAATSCMFMALDLGVGEKERSTLETLLTTAASRVQIVVGKLLAISTIGFVAACLSLVGLWLSVVWVGGGGGKLMDVLLEILELRTVIIVLSMILPLVVLFAALELSLSLYSNNMKEAQSLMSPLMFVAIVPAIMGAIPGFELNWWSSLVPIFNISLATKAVLAGTAETLHLVLVFVSTLLASGLSVAFTVWWFQREKTLFRS